MTGEFLVGTGGLIALAVILWARGSWLWAAWALGCGANYGVLVAHAVSLYPTGRLDEELEGVDVRSEFRRYSIAQLLLFIPALIAIAAAFHSLRNLRSPSASADVSTDRSRHACRHDER